MEIFIGHPDQLLKEIWKDHNVHIVQSQHSIGRHKFCLIDISINAQGTDQDQIYTDSLFYRTNIRRGNTLVEIIDHKSKEKNKIRWGRKGIQKIIDIRLEYLQNVTNKVSLNKEQKKSADYIFRNVNRCLQKGKRIQLLKTQKANGQNAQVSYFYELDAWIVCFKNVSMIVTCVQDIQTYQGKRYKYAKQIAKQWFEQIKSLDKQKIKKLKKLLDGFTLVGEYCGNPEHQHLIIYAETRIIWFSLVDNFTEEYCVDPFEVKRQVEDFGFKFVKIKRLGSFIDKNTLYSALQNLYIKIAEASMEDQQYGLEGSIIYFVSPEMKQNKAHTKVLGSGKLKSIEYRFFRTIREKLSRYVNRKQSQVELVSNFQDECLQLKKSSNSSAPYPQHYYTQILRKGCELIRQVKIKEDFLRSKFCSILKLLFYVIFKNISLKSFGSKMITNSYFLNQVTKLQLQKYGPLGCNTKVIFFSTDLVQLKDKTTNEYLANHFEKMKLCFKQLQFDNARNNETQRLFNQINKPSVPEKFPYLMHFHVDGYSTIQDIQKIANKLKNKGKKDVHHQILLITDQISSGELFKNNQDEFPFRLQTIVFSYYRVYQQVKNTPTIQQRIDGLKKVTEGLKSKDSFMQQFSKHGFKHFQYPMSNLVNFQENQKTQLTKIVSGLLSGQKQYQNYCRLILRLDKYTQDRFPSQREQQTNTRIKSLMKSSFHDIPEIDFQIKI